ncbi:MAG: hypothetical protein RLZ75_1135 [Pseudomonadota bacterium]
MPQIILLSILLCILSSYCIIKRHSFDECSFVFLIHTTRLQRNNMIKIFHLTFILLSISTFIGRVILSETHPAILKQKALKIAPHVIDSLLLLSGITLIFQGGWFSMEYGWIFAKILALVGYIGLGIIVMRNHGTTRWLAFAGAMACFVYIGVVAVTKDAFFFF